MEHFDVAIIGLGPAGSALARKLAGKMQVIALDKKHQCGTEGFSKPCGGLLAPDAQRSFIRDGLTLPVDVIANPQIFSVKTVDVAASLTRNYQRSYININRHAFDLWMKSLIPASVEVYHDSLCRKIWREDDKWHVIFRADGWEQHITARYLVGADGANSMVRRHLYAQWCGTYSTVEGLANALHIAHQQDIRERANQRDGGDINQCRCETVTLRQVPHHQRNGDAAQTTGEVKHAAG